MALLAGVATAGAQHPGYSNICSTHWGWCPLNPEIMVIVGTPCRCQGGRWRRVGAAESSAGGRYAFTLERAGRYRVIYRGDAGPAVTVR